MLREKEAWQQGIHSQQPLSRQRDDLVVRLFEIALVVQRLELRSEPFEDAGIVLVAKIGGLQGSSLQLEDELADHAFFVRWPVSAAERNSTLSHCGIVSVP